MSIVVTGTGEERAEAWLGDGSVATAIDCMSRDAATSRSGKQTGVQ